MLEDQSPEVVTLFPCSGLQGFNTKNHIFLARAGREKDRAINNPTIDEMTIDEARTRFQNSIIEMSGSHSICKACKEHDFKHNMPK